MTLVYLESTSRSTWLAKLYHSLIYSIVSRYTSVIIKAYLFHKAYFSAILVPNPIPLHVDAAIRNHRNLIRQRKHSLPRFMSAISRSVGHQVFNALLGEDHSASTCASFIILIFSSVYSSNPLQSSKDTQSSDRSGTKHNGQFHMPSPVFLPSYTSTDTFIVSLY